MVAAGPENGASYTTPPLDGKRKILIVDDERDVANVLRRFLELEGYLPVTANTGADGLECVAAQKFDLLVTDLRMPQMSGIELIREVRKIDNDIPIIVITGFGSMELFMEATREGASDFVLKPVDRAQFLGSVSRALERGMLHERLMAQTQKLIQSEKMATVGLLATGIAHEINNPVTFIRSNLQLLTEYIKRMKPRLENLDDEKNRAAISNIILEEFPQMIDEAVRGTERVEAIVGGIKHYAHMGEENFADTVDIREVIKHSVNLVRSKLRQNIKINENYLNIREISGNFSKLEQVFVNLLVNAADAINDKISALRKAGDRDAFGLIDVSATVIEGDEVDGVTTPDNLILTFYDNGGGIADDKLKSIFDPFFTTKAVGVGTGLGLYICYEIITQHGGEITVQSEKGEGTAFIIKLPVDGVASEKKKGTEKKNATKEA